MQRLLILAVLAALVALGGRYVGDEDATGARVVEVIDGDTLDVRVENRRERVRVLGIDTPERGDCGHRRATQALRAAAAGRRVVLISDPTQDARDRYDRLLAYVEVRRGRRDVGEAVVRQGWARVYVFDRAFRRAGRYRAAARKARAEGRGLHRACPGVLP